MLLFQPASVGLFSSVAVEMAARIACSAALGAASPASRIKRDTPHLAALERAAGVLGADERSWRRLQRLSMASRLDAFLVRIAPNGRALARCKAGRGGFRKRAFPTLTPWQDLMWSCQLNAETT